MATIGRNVNLLQLNCMLQPGYQKGDTLGSGGVFLYDSASGDRYSGFGKSASQLETFRINGLWRVDWQVDELAKQAPAPWLKDDTSSHESQAFAYAFMTMGHDGIVPPYDSSFHYEAAGKKSENSRVGSPNDDLCSTKEQLKEALKHIVDVHLDGDVRQIGANRTFLQTVFSLQDGYSVSGSSILGRVASLECPDLPTIGDAVKEVGLAAAAKIARQRYLGFIDWNESPENLKAAFEHVVETQLEGDIHRIRTNQTFMQRKFTLTDGSRVSGRSMLQAVTILERPDLSAKKAFATIGSAEAIRIALKNFFGYEKWDASPGKLRETLEYFVATALDGDVSRVTSGSAFRQIRVSLPCGLSVTGGMMLGAVARFEQIDAKQSRGAKKLSGAEVARIAREKYLGYESWESSTEKLKEVLEHIVATQLDGQVWRINSGTDFRPTEFTLPDGSTCKGSKLLSIVAALECPGIPQWQAVREIGPKEASRIAREKYLGVRDWDADAEQLRKTLQHIVETQLDGQTSRVGGVEFGKTEFTLPDGSTCSGLTMLSAVSFIEFPEFARGEGVAKIGAGETARIAREKYFGVKDWDSSPEALKATLQYVVENYLSGDVGRITTSSRFADSEFILSDGSRISGSQLLYTVASFEYPDLQKGEAYHKLGGGETARIAREHYLEYEAWDSTREGMAEAVEYFVDMVLDGDAWQLSRHDTRGLSVTLPCGAEVTGTRLLYSVAALEHPNLSRSKAYEKIGGTEAVRIAQKYYATAKGWESLPEKKAEGEEWLSSPEKLREALQYIVATQFDGQPWRFAGGVRSERFKLPGGETCSGYLLIKAIVSFEHPDMTAGDIMRLIGDTEATRIAREKYLDYKDWDSSPERLKETLKFVVKTYLDDNPLLISTTSDFVGRQFEIPEGFSVSGGRLLRAVAAFEHSDMGVMDALNKIGYAEAVNIARKKYFGYEAWDSSPKKLQETLRYFVNSAYDGDVQRIVSHSSFISKKIQLPDGPIISGHQLLFAVAGFERPDMPKTLAYKEIGGSETARIAREDYLDFEAPDRWDATPEKLKAELRYIVETQLDGNVQGISAGSDFVRSTWTLIDGTQVTGHLLLTAVAIHEHPDLLRVDALDKLGRAEAVRIAHKKYFDFETWDSSPETLKEALLHVLSTQLGGVPWRISAAAEFTKRRFDLPDGTECSGERLLRAVALFEYADLERVEALTKMGRKEAARIALEKYVGYVAWDATPKRLKETLLHIVETHLDGKPWRMGVGTTFRQDIFMTPEGEEVSGYKLLQAVAAFEHPELNRWKALNAMSASDLTTVIQRKYLEYEAWDSSPQKLKEALEYILETQLKGDASGITSNQTFTGRRFLLPEGYKVSGHMILTRVAAFEYPEMRMLDALRRMGYAEAARAAREEYLGFTGPELEEIQDLPGISLLADTPLELMELIRVLLPKGERMSLAEFLRSYAMLNLKEVTPDGVGGGSGHEGIAEGFLDALFSRRELLENLDEEKLDRLHELYIHTLYREHSVGGESLLARLESRKSRSTDPIMERFYDRAIEHFEGILSLELVNIKSPLFMHQRSAIKYLAERDRAILADEPGLGKTLEALAAAELSDSKRILIVAPARGVSTWAEEIEKHMEEVPDYIVLRSEDKVKLLSGDKEFRAKLEAAKYIIVNYEALREPVDRKDSNPLLAYLRNGSGIDHIIVDESQNMDNPRATVQQAEAVRSLRPQRRWLVSATPYQSKRAHLFTALNYIDPKRFVWEDDGNGGDERISYRKFREVYLKGDENSLKMLNGLLRQYMLRRRKDQVVGTVDETKPLETQRGRIPSMDYVPHEQQGAFPLSDEQALMMREMIADFRGWAARYNEWVEAYNDALPAGADAKMRRRPINIENINPLSKLGWIRRIIADPQIAGLKRESPLYDKLDRVVETYRAEGKKLILFANHTRVIDTLQERYGEHGVVRIDGTVSRDAQDEARRAFNEDSGTTIVVAHPRSGGVGINLPAGDVVIFVEQPQTYVWRYQAEHRANRANPDFIKPTVKVISMVGTYPQGFIDEIEEEVRQYFVGGTVSEIEAELIAKNRLEYLLVVDGYVDRSDFELNMRDTIAGALGWKQEELPARIRRRPQLYDVLEALYDRWKDLPHRRRRELVNVGEGILSTDIKKDDVQRIIASIAGGRQADTDIAGSVFRLRNRFVRQKLLKSLFIELPVLHEYGGDASEYAQDLEAVPNAVRRLIVPILLATRPWEGEASFEVMKGLIAELSKMRGTPREVLAERAAVALATLGDDADVRDFIERHESIFLDANVPLEDRMRIFSDLAMLKGITDRYLRNVLQTDYASFEALGKQLGERATRPVIKAMELPDTPEVRGRLRDIHDEWGDFEALLALHRGWKKAGYAEESASLREMFGHIIAGDYHASRNDQTVTRTSGKHVEYLADKPDFWTRWNEEMTSRTDEIRIGGVKRRRELVKRVGHIMMEALKSGEMAKVEGDLVTQTWQNYIDADTASREKIKKALEERKRALGNILSKGRGGASAEELKTAGFEGTNGMTYEKVRAELHDVNAALDWIALNETIRAFAKGGNGEMSNLLARLIKRKMIVYGGDGAITSPLGMEFYNAGQELDALKSEQKVFKDVEIVDTDDPNLILRMGALRPDLINCFNFHADPDQNHTILDVLGSRNKRLIVAKSDGEVVAIAVAKVRKDDEGKPVIFLERALYREGYDFQDEMLAHLKKKRAGMDLKPHIAYQIPGKAKKGDIKVYATGSYTKNEYAEALFGVRPEHRVWHRARLIEEDMGMQTMAMGSDVVGFGDEVDGITGYGTSNRDISTFITAMKAKGIRMVVDIRSRPQSRWFPHFNRKRLEAALEENGIGYVWMGDTLGGYPDGYDGNFRRYMNEDPDGNFSKGIERLRELAKEHGKMSLVCSEGDEKQCHRRFILKHLRGQAAVRQQDLPL